ncbi:xylulokinase [Sediminispirochaeta smaragdinae]|uniref:Carbohydrate kinase, FGGY n=1 Tax=Sediminispirochaeta smaragdinae (strain DSM 11293 / JCM 15392 / SEBR 4228) TaxID=573413 RepID=E1R5Y2_SEDSS|nr:FGGY-family carbohydrate kinase [Sediminispirochaeta smaragdinae]ADK80747.1 Carbohydrate kinase, FGGY [Sediminispirochaeta smaragdinae DSM 11293]
MFLGFDIGTGSVKCTLLSEAGSVKTFSAGYEGLPGSVGRQESGTLIDALRRLLGEAASFARSSGEAIKALSASGHGPSLVVLNKRGEAEPTFLTWQDASASAEAEEIAAAIPGFTKTGECWEAKLLSAWRRLGSAWHGERALYPKDFALYLLCGRIFTDRSTATTLAFYDADASTWRQPLCGIDERFFPEVLESWEEVGRTRTTFSRACGLEDGIAVFGGGIDAWCEALGAGAVEEGMLVDGSGTSTCLSICRPKDEEPLEHVIPGKSYRIETISFTGGSIRWAEQLLGLSVDRWKREYRASGPIPLLFLPYLIGERSPIWDEDASALFIGLRSSHDAGAVMHAVLQGTACAVGQCLSLITPKIEGSIVRAVGGGAENLPWLGMKAGITGASFAVMREKDASPLGAAILAAFGSGHGSLRELTKRFAKIERTIEPDPAVKEQYGRLAGSYRRLYEIVKDEMKLLAEERRRR